MADPTLAADYPVFSGATAKQDILRALLAVDQGSPNLRQVIIRINRSDISTVTDGDTVYATADCFGAAE